MDFECIGLDYDFDFLVKELFECCWESNLCM